MILVTVGTQLAFDRLITAVDDWAGVAENVSIYAQIGPSRFVPRHIRFADFVPPNRANQLFQEAELIVSHAGMGSILTALKFKKPILILPRKASLGEHRNEHQLATAKWLGSRPGITVAWDTDDLKHHLDCRRNLVGGNEIDEYASPVLIERLRNFMRSS